MKQAIYFPVISIISIYSIPFSVHFSSLGINISPLFVVMYNKSPSIWCCLTHHKQGQVGGEHFILFNSRIIRI